MTPEMTTADIAAAAEAKREQHGTPLLAAPKAMNEQNAALFTTDQLTDLRRKWDEIQGAFVDEPRGAVERADALVAQAISQMAEGFARTRADLDRQWKKGDNVSTEDLRQALQHYRSFFTRLLNA
jgi:hypothetical protein